MKKIFGWLAFVSFAALYATVAALECDVISPALALLNGVGCLFSLGIFVAIVNSLPEGKHRG